MHHTFFFIVSNKIDLSCTRSHSEESEHLFILHFKVVFFLVFPRAEPMSSPSSSSVKDVADVDAEQSVWHAVFYKPLWCDANPVAEGEM